MKSECVLKLDWDKVWREFDRESNSLSTRTYNKYIIKIEEIITNHINIAIEELVQNHITNTNTNAITIHLDYIKQEYNRMGLDTIRAIRCVRKLTGMTLKDAKDLVDSWRTT